MIRFNSSVSWVGEERKIEIVCIVLDSWSKPLTGGRFSSNLHGRNFYDQVVGIFCFNQLIRGRLDTLITISGRVLGWEALIKLDLLIWLFRTKYHIKIIKCVKERWEATCDTAAEPDFLKVVWAHTLNTERYERAAAYICRQHNLRSGLHLTPSKSVDYLFRGRCEIMRKCPKICRRHY